MPIAINGSGTVTGVSVGGLPDGIVDTDMIAAAAVTEPKRGPGTILQIVGNSQSSAVTTTGTTFVDTGITQNITLLRANSKVLCIGNISCDTARDDQNISARIRMVRSGASSDTGDRTYGGNDKNVGGYVGGNGSNHARFVAQFTMTGLDTELGNEAAGTTLTYKFQCRVENSGNNADMRINSNNEISFITLMEISV